MSTDDIIISQPAGVRTLALRESYLAICEGDKCEAHLLNANERWYAYKLKQRRQARHINKVAEAGGETPEADESLWVFMSAYEWVGELLGVYNEKTLRRKLSSLVERGFLATRTNPKRKWDRKPQWLFKRANVQAAVDAWAITRTPPELDPSEADQAQDKGQGDTGQGGEVDQNDSGNADNSTRENARMESDKVPNGVGQSSDSIRENARSNTTGISHRDLSQESFPGGVLPVEGDARTREAQSGVLPVAEDHAPHTTGKASLQNNVGGDPFTTALGRLSTPVAPSPDVAVHEPPVGGAADAVQGENLISKDDLELLFGGQDSHATDPEDVPGGAAGACGAPEAPRNPRVADLASVPRDELLGRPVARGESPQLRMIRSLVTGKRLPELLEQPTPTGALSREDWLRLTLDELEQVKVAAQTEAREQNGNMITLSIAGLDRMIGAVPRPKSPRPGDEGGADPAQVTRFDPHLAPGGRCAVDGEPGVVFTVTSAHYIVDLDCGDRLSVSRGLRAELRRLKASDAPAPVLSPREAEVNRYEVGACWSERKSGAEVVITGTAQVRHRAGQRLQYTLSSGQQLSVLDLTLGYVFIGQGRAETLEAAD